MTPPQGAIPNLTDLPGEDTNPVAGAAGEMYFLSERDGRPVNVYRAALTSRRKGRGGDRLPHPSGALPLACR